MAYEYKKHVMVDGKKYGPSPGNKYYQPAEYHNPVKKPHNKGRKAKKAEHEERHIGYSTSLNNMMSFLKVNQMSLLIKAASSPFLTIAMKY